MSKYFSTWALVCFATACEDLVFCSAQVVVLEARCQIHCNKLALSRYCAEWSEHDAGNNDFQR